MNDLAIAVLIIIAIIGGIILFKILKPYIIKCDTTLAFTGGLGSGKTLSAVKKGVVLYRKVYFTKYILWNKVLQPIQKWFKDPINKRRIKYNIKHHEEENFKEKKLLKIYAKRKPPKLYSNIPIHFKKHLFGTKRIWSTKLTAPMILLLEEMREYSIVIIDELPQFINQFNWNEQLIQKNVNEWITFFRHYIGGYIITTSQSIDDVVVQIRRKLNQATWCYDFKKHLFGLFYTIRMCDIMLGEQIGTISTTFIEENTKLHFGLFPPKGTYDTRCYSPRYKNIYKKEKDLSTPQEKWKEIKTTKVLRLQQYISPLDDTTTELQKKEQWEKGEQIWKN